jgi:hypothetical protein
MTQFAISELTDKLRSLQAMKQWLSKPAPYPMLCGCTGPTRGEPFCPCAMRWVENVDGVWYKITEHRSSNGLSYSARKLVQENDHEQIN